MDQRGGNDYPALIRKTEPKPLRVFLQDGSNDLNKVGGNWFLANQEMLSALEFAGYEVNHVWGEGGHNGKQATAIFPDAMRWLWKDWPKPIESGFNSNQPVAQVLVRGEPWQAVGEGYAGVGGLAANAQGEVFFSDPAKGCIRKIGLDGSVTGFAQNTGPAQSLTFGPNGLLYAVRGSSNIRAYDSRGVDRSVGGKIGVRDSCIAHNGNIYFTVSWGKNRQIWLLDSRKETVVDSDPSYAAYSGICLTPDQSLLLVLLC